MGIRRLMGFDPDRFRVQALAVISEDEMIPLCEKYGIHWTMAENKPVGRKKNAGLNEAFKYEWDYLLEIGSDDLLRNDILELYAPLMEKGLPVFGTNRLVFYDSITGQARNYKSDALAMGRMMKRTMLEDVTFSVECEVLVSFITGGEVCHKGTQLFLQPARARSLESSKLVRIIGEPCYHLWANHLNRGLDNNSNSLIMSRGVPLRHIDTVEPLGMDVKSEVNIWHFNPDNGSPYNADDFMKHCSTEERTMLNSIRKLEYA
jgi:hypothetical protein